MKKIFALKTALFLLPLMLLGQVEQTNEQKLLEGIGKYKIGETASSLFRGESVRSITRKLADHTNAGVPRSAIMRGPWQRTGVNKYVKISDVPGHSYYTHINYKLNEEISLNLRLEFYNDTLYSISTDKIYTTNPNGEHNYYIYGDVDKLLIALEMAGYLANKRENSEIKTYQNAMGARYDKNVPFTTYFYRTPENIMAKGHYTKEYPRINEEIFYYSIEIYDENIFKRIENIKSRNRNSQQQERRTNLTEGL